MKTTAIAPANIAFIKYWGKKDEKLRLPLNSSTSMNLSNCLTTTTVEFSRKYQKDEVQTFDKERIIKHLDRIRSLTKIKLKAKVVSKNSFPSGVGIASSASGFAALTLAATGAAGLKLSGRELSILARSGSGSACRSIPDGFVQWEKGVSSNSSYAYSLYPTSHWDLRDIICLVGEEEKEMGSTAGMAKAFTSPFMKARLKGIDEQSKKVKKALKERNLKILGEIIEKEAINMHAVAMTQKPPLFYWNGTTVETIHAVAKWRSSGLPVYFTIDAGPNVHLICQGKDERKVVKLVKLIAEVKDVIINKPVKGAYLTEKHLF